MFTNKLSKPFLAIVVAALTLVTVSFIAAPKASEPYLDYALRHPGEVIVPVTGQLDTANSDYFQRHPELTAPSLLGQDASDYFQRHPELTAPAEASIDMTDYFFRHPELRRGAGNEADMTDYYFRHLNQ